MAREIGKPWNELKAATETIARLEKVVQGDKTSRGAKRVTTKRGSTTCSREAPNIEWQSRGEKLNP